MAGLTDDKARRLARLALAVSVLLASLRLHIALSTGFGDGEALYASYALFRQPAYLDHPGLIGLLAGWVGGGTAPDPQRAHIFTSLAATLVPWLGFAAARATGATQVGALATVLTLALVPELSIGLYAMSPDLPLAVFWLGALGLAALALRSAPSSFRALAATLGVGVAVGLACLAKITGVLLGLALLATALTAPVRARWRTLAPWAAVCVALVLIVPVLSWEWREDYPMLRHRLVTTQAAAGFSLRNLGLLLGGQLAYVTPPFLVGALLVLRHLWRHRRDDEVSRLLWLSTVVVGIPLLGLCAWSRVAEPHWLAPAYLPLALHLSRCRVVGKRLAVGSLVTGAAVTILAWAWVSTPLPIRVLGKHYRARYDLANDLYAWGPGRRLLVEAVRDTVLSARLLPVVVGPHWTVCAQAQAALLGKVAVGCNTPIRDDFDRWLPRERWLRAPVILFVHDSRFEIDPARELPGRKVASISRVDVRRGGQVVRMIRVTRLDRSLQLHAAPGQPSDRRRLPVQAGHAQ
jgi:hypothetical protein